MILLPNFEALKGQPLHRTTPEEELPAEGRCLTVLRWVSLMHKACTVDSATGMNGVACSQFCASWILQESEVEVLSMVGADINLMGWGQSCLEAVGAVATCNAQDQLVQ